MDRQGPIGNNKPIYKYKFNHIFDYIKDNGVINYIKNIDPTDEKKTDNVNLELYYELFNGYIGFITNTFEIKFSNPYIALAEASKLKELKGNESPDVCELRKLIEMYFLYDRGVLCQGNTSSIFSNEDLFKKIIIEYLKKLHLGATAKDSPGNKKSNFMSLIKNIILIKNYEDDCENKINGGYNEFFSSTYSDYEDFNKENYLFCIETDIKLVVDKLKIFMAEKTLKRKENHQGYGSINHSFVCDMTFKFSNFKIKYNENFLGSGNFKGTDEFVVNDFEHRIEKFFL